MSERLTSVESFPRPARMGFEDANGMRETGFRVVNAENVTHNTVVHHSSWNGLRHLRILRLTISLILRVTYCRVHESRTPGCSKPAYDISPSSTFKFLCRTQLN